MSLILSTVEKGPELSPADKGDRIVLRAEMVLAGYRFNKAKVSEIAGLAGVAEDLFLLITGARSKGHTELLSEICHINTPRRKLRRFISEN